MSASRIRLKRKVCDLVRNEPISARKSRRLLQNLYASNNSGSSVNCTNHPLRYPNSDCSIGVIKYARGLRNAKKQQKTGGKRRNIHDDTTAIPITPQMIRGVVKELQTKRVFVSSGLIATQLKRQFPIENDPDTLEEELEEKLKCAVHVGLVSKCGDDAYCLPTLRQEASMDKTAFTAFWDRYYGSTTLRMDYLASSETSNKRGYRKKDAKYRSKRRNGL